MTDVAPAPALGLVERVAALHRVRPLRGVPGRVLAAVAEAATEVRARTRRRADHRGRGRGAPVRHRRGSRPGAPRRARRSSSSVRASPSVSSPSSFPQPRTASVTALEPTLVLRLDKAVLDDLLADWPELAHGVIAVLVARLRAIAERADRGP